MLLSFSVENWRSFRDRATFSMIASAEKNFKDRTMKVSGRPIVRLLPTAAIFGGNASGKSNLVSAIASARKFIVGGNPKMDGQTGFDAPFRLDAESLGKPTRFSFVMLVNIKEKPRVFEYTFGVTQTAVTEEKLIQRDFSGNQKVIFHRELPEGGKEKFEGILAQNERIQFVFAGTRRDALFLRNAYFQNVAEIEPVVKWFSDSLHVIGPEMKYCDENILKKQDRLKEFADILDKYDTGISGVTLEEAPPAAAGIASFMLEREGFFNGPRRMDIFGRGEVIFASEKGGSVECKELKTLRSAKDGQPVKFSFSDESDGTRRLVDIIPICQSLAHEPGSVFIVDELDRRLHPNLVESIVRDYLSGIEENSRAQLIFTTHDANLMDQRTLRRDEIWLVERGQDGASELFSLMDFDARKDENIRKAYLIGRFGGIPRV
jgi:AAA15 family ATPase/GTPase